MNVQTEKLDSHIARLTVEIDIAQLDKAKKQVAKRLARRVNIPGFRKGKAPYRILVGYVGEGAILEEAVEELGNQIYRDALIEGDIQPYANGELEDFKLDPQPTFVFAVPMAPTVELNDYLSVRASYEAVTVEDSEVEEAIRDEQAERAVVEDLEEPAAMGHRVVADYHVFFTDMEETEEEDASESEAESDADEESSVEVESESDDAEVEDDPHARFNDAVLHEHHAEIDLDTETEPIPGFAEALVGVSAEEEREFELTYPDEETYGEYAGRKMRFVVNVHHVQSVTLPEVDDEFAAEVTADEETPLNLADWRAKLREDLLKQKTEAYDAEYYGRVMEAIIEGAEFAYPDAMVHEQIDSLIESMSQQFGVSVDDYLRLTQQSREVLYDNDTYREAAINYIKQSLVMQSVFQQTEISVSDEDVNAEIDRYLVQFGDQADSYRALFDTPEMRASVENSLIEGKIRDHIAAIGRGEVVAEAETATQESDSVAADTGAAELASSDSDSETEESDAVAEDAPADEDEN